MGESACERKFMNRKIKLCHAITYIILFYLAAAIFLLGPMGVLKKDRTIAGSENPIGTVQVSLEQQVQQVFVAEGTYLRYLEIYVTSEESQDKDYHLYLYNEDNEVLINKEIRMPESEVPGFLRIPVGIETVPGKMYVWQLKGIKVPMDIAYENTGETGLLTFGNWYFLKDGTSEMQTAQNIVMRLTYTDSPSAVKMAAAYGILIVLAAVLIGFAEYSGLKKDKLNKEIRVQTPVILTVGPVLAAGYVYLIYAAFGANLFGGQKEDKIVYALGIGLSALYFAWVLLAKRRKTKQQPIRSILEKNWMDWLQTLTFAGVLLGTTHFMNAQYQVWQDLAYREVLFWILLVLLTMGPAKTVANRWGAVWTVISSIAGLIFYVVSTAKLAEEQQAERSILKYEILIVIAAGLVLLSLVDKIRRKTFAWGKINRWYAGMLAVFMLLLVIFSNTRGWPVYLAVVFGLFYAFYIGWEKRDHLLINFSNGIILHFALATIFCLARRPYRSWYFPRYNHVFHTVTITAYYLTLVICVLTARLLSKLHFQQQSGDKKARVHLIEMWGTLLLYGMAMAFLFLTLSRTGYLAVAAMLLIVVPFATFFVYRKGILAFVRNVALFGVTAVLCLPVTYCGIRMLPAIYNDPYIYEVEDSAAAIHKDDPADCRAYMWLSYFKYQMETKLFSDASAETEARELMLCLKGDLYVRPVSYLVASEDEMTDLEEFSNGRFDIFESYIKNWNLTGHDEMGVDLPNGTISVHAHNTYLQVIHDHGLIVGVFFVLLGAVSAIRMFVFALKKKKENPAALLPIAVLIGFAVAGLVEWLYHPCNPMGFSVMVIFAPLLCFKGAECDEG